jgi:hypothetical protein
MLLLNWADLLEDRGTRAPADLPAPPLDDLPLDFTLTGCWLIGYY